MKQKLLFGLQCAVTLGLLGWIFRSPEMRDNLWVIAGNADLRWVAAAVAVAGIESFLGAVRWRIFLGVLGVSLPFWQTVRLFYLGLFSGSFFVGSVGGDAVKVFALIGLRQKKTAALLSVVLDRTSGIFALVATTGVFVSWHYEWLAQSEIVSGLVYFLFAYLGGAVLFLALTFAAARFGLHDRLPEGVPFRENLLQMGDMYALFVRCWAKSLLGASISFLMLGGYFLIFYCSMRAYGVELELGKVFALMPVVDVISSMPVSLGGVGVRESLFVLLLGKLAGVSEPVAVWISLTGFMASLFWGIAGVFSLPQVRGLVEKGKALSQG